MIPIERVFAVPPLSWVVTVHYWCTDQLRQFLQPVTRPIERHLARVKLRELVALRALCAGRPELQACLDGLITERARRYVNLARREED